MSFRCNVAHQVLLKFTKSWTVFEQHCPPYDLNVFVHWFHHLIIFLCPQLIWILFVFLLRVHYIVPGCSTFQGVSRSVNFISVENLQTQSFFFFDKSFLFWNQLSHFKDHVYSKSSLLKWNERCFFFWKRSFENQAFWSKTQHTSFKICHHLIVLYFEKKIDPL